MSKVGTADQPLRIAIIGAGPAGFYAAGHLLQQKDWVIEVDLYDRLPTPYGLVRGGVAPDHQKIKSVTKVYAKIAAHPRFRFFGNVELGKHLFVEDLREHYHQFVYATGAQTDRSLGIPGEDLKRSHSATEFVAWYNGHPDYCDLSFDLSHEHVVIVGVGNVAVDVARILCRTPEELATTDIADYALQALRESQVRKVYMLGRRGPAQAAFTNPEIKELGELQDATASVPEDEAILDPLSRAALDRAPSRETERKVEIIQKLAENKATDKSKRLIIRFLVSPVEILSDDSGGVSSVRLVKNELYITEDGRLRPRATGQFETLPAGLVFRSVGYRGVPLPGVPFQQDWGIIPNQDGRVIDPKSKRPLVGEYTAGWIKRGPSGVIGTNKSDAQETVDHMLEDASAGKHLHPQHTKSETILSLLHERQPDVVTFVDWRYLDQVEVRLGKASGRPRVKYTSIPEMLKVLASADALFAEETISKPALRPEGKSGSAKLPPGMKPGGPPSRTAPRKPPTEFIPKQSTRAKLPPGMKPGGPPRATPGTDQIPPDPSPQG